MHNLRSIRERLGVTQQVLADGIGCTQGNIGHYERGQTLPPDSARKLIAFARARGVDLTFDDIYAAPEDVLRMQSDATPKPAALAG